jgi:hypothetical protein
MRAISPAQRFDPADANAVLKAHQNVVGDHYRSSAGGFRASFRIANEEFLHAPQGVLE